MHAYTNIKGNNKANKLLKQGTHNRNNPPFHHIGHTTPFWHVIPPSTQYDSSIHNLKRQREKEHKSTFTSHTTNIVPNVQKWLFINNIHLKWSNIFWYAPWITNAQITQVLTMLLWKLREQLLKES